MIGAEDVDETVEAPSEGVMVVGDVAAEIRRLAVASHDRAILLVTEARGAEEERTLLVVQQVRGQRRAGAHEDAVGMERPLAHEPIETDAEAGKIFADPREQQAGGEIAATCDRVRLGCRRELLAVLRGERPGDVDEILSRVGVLSELDVLAPKLAVADPRRSPEHVHLPAEVVHVVFALDLETGRLEEARRDVAEDRAPAMPDVQGSRRIRAHELDMHAASGAGVGAAVGIAGRQRLGEQHPPERRREADVDEPGSRDLGGREPAAGVAEAREHGLGDDARRLPGLPREHERHVGRQIAELQIGRHLDRKGRRSVDGKLSRRDRVDQRLAKERFKVPLHPGPHGAKAGRRDTARAGAGTRP